MKTALTLALLLTAVVLANAPRAIRPTLAQITAIEAAATLAFVCWVALQQERGK